LTITAQLVKLKVGVRMVPTARIRRMWPDVCGLVLVGFGITKYLIILVIILLLFSSRLPSIARSLGQSLIEFKKGIKELENSSDEKKSE
jgi:sec-independent protein translocase protein TatA